MGGVIGMVSSSATESQTTAQQMTATAAESASRSTAVAAASELAPRSEHLRAEVRRFLATVRAA